MVPTSFVPRSTTSFRRPEFRRPNFDFGGAFSFLGYGALGLVLLLGAGLFGYGWYLSNQEASKKEELQKAEAMINTTTVESLIHLNAHLKEGKRLLEAHVVLSSVFNLFEALSPTTIRLSSLTLGHNETLGITLTASGVAASVNALAALSEVLNSDDNFKSVVFSGLQLQKTGVSFGLSSSIDPKLVAFLAPEASTTTPAMTTATTTATTTLPKMP
jgi:hypothetical protein